MTACVGAVSFRDKQDGNGSAQRYAHRGKERGGNGRQKYVAQKLAPIAAKGNDNGHIALRNGSKGVADIDHQLENKDQDEHRHLGGIAQSAQDHNNRQQNKFWYGIDEI